MKVNNLWRYPTYLNTIQEVVVIKVARPASSLPAGTRCYILRTICTLENRRTVRLRGKVGFDKKNENGLLGGIGILIQLRQSGRRAAAFVGSALLTTFE
jgi:hypothetical protein